MAIRTTQEKLSSGGGSIGSVVSGGTQGSVLFLGASGVLAQDNANLFFDDTNNRLGILTSSPQAPLHVNSSFNTLGLRIGSSGANGFGDFGSNAIQVYGNSVGAALIGSGGGFTGIRIQSSGQYSFSDTTAISSGNDTGIARSATGVIKITNGSSGDGGILAGGGVSIGTSAASPAIGQFSTYASAVQKASLNTAGLDLFDTANINFSSTSSSQGSKDLIVGRAAAAKLRLGATDAASPIAQTLSVQNVVAGTSNTAGADFTIAGSQGTGTGAGGNILLQIALAGTTGTSQNSLTTIATISSVGAVVLPMPTATIGGASGVFRLSNDTSGNLRPAIFSTGNGTSLATYGNGAPASNNASMFTNYIFSGTGMVLGRNAVSGAVTPGVANGLGFGDGTTTVDTWIGRDAANTLAMRNSTNGQTVNLYGTYTDASNYERLSISATATANVITLDAAGTGTRRPLKITSVTVGDIAQFNATTNVISFFQPLRCVAIQFTTDNTSDIGGGSLRPRDVIIGRFLTTGSTITCGGDFFATGSAVIGWTSRSYFRSNTNGNVTVYNSAGTDFGLIQFGGTTSSFPALKRSSANLQARLADDSAYTDIEVADEAYDATAWNGSLEVPTKNAIRDKLESLSSGSSLSYVTGGTSAAANNINISGLDLDTDTKYIIIVKWYIASLSTASDIELTFNADSASGNYAYAFNGYGRISDVNGVYQGAGEGTNGVKLCDAYGMGELELTIWQNTDGTNESKRVMGKAGTLSHPFATGQAREVTTVQNSGVWQDNANVTSIQFDITGSSDTANWEYRVYKIINS